ncbi:MAG: DNA polymerase III subunit beta [Candidatus Magasanikbacteria bacterium]|nr:DNA polymerase III subunit beta [Candidatus Magasanikbacteria bacterium]
MKFTCMRENFVYSLDLVSSLAVKHANLPILENVLLKVQESGIELCTTNLEIAVKTHLRAKVEQTGEFTVPAKTLSEYVRLLSSEQVDLELKNNELLVQCGNSSTKIKGVSAEDYPVIPDIDEQHAYTFDVEEFRNSISRTVIAAAKNEIRPELSGVFFSFKNERFDGLLMAATDSYRLAEARVDIKQGVDSDVSCIVPARVAQEMSRLLQLGKMHESENLVRLWVSDNQIAIRYDNFEMTSRLIDGKYPDYAQIIPKDFKTRAVFSLDAMVNKIKAASIFTTIGVNAVSFDLNVSQSTIGVSSMSTQTGEHSSEVDAHMSGDENSILLNHRYVLDGLSHMQSEEAEFNVTSADAPCLFRPKGKENYLYIVMPIRQ